MGGKRGPEEDARRWILRAGRNGAQGGRVMGGKGTSRAAKQKGREGDATRLRNTRSRRGRWGEESIETAYLRKSENNKSQTPEQVGRKVR